MGAQTRSFCYVDDLIEGFVHLMATPSEVTGPMNIGNPSELTIKEIAQVVIRLTGSISVIRHMPLPEDDPKQRRPDIFLATEILGWRPAVASKTGSHRLLWGDAA